MRKAIISQEKGIVPVKPERAVKVKKKKEETPLTKYTKDLISERPLTIQQEIFCQYYVKSKEYRGNGTWCYAIANGIDLENLSKVREIEIKEIGGREVEVEIPGTSEYEKKYQVCNTLANRLLQKVTIQNRKVKLLNEMLTNDIVDSRMAEWILSDDETASTKMISEYNKLKQRIINKSENLNQHTMLGIVRHIYEEADENEPS